MIKAVLDTNIFISFLLKKKGLSIWRLYDLWEEVRFTNYYSLITLRELVDVLSRAKIQDQAMIEIAEIKELLREMIERSVMIRPLHRAEKVLDDEEDQIFLDIASTARAHYIISGDKGLLNLREYQGGKNMPLIKIVSVTEFLQLVEGSSGC